MQSPSSLPAADSAPSFDAPPHPTHPPVLEVKPRPHTHKCSITESHTSQDLYSFKEFFYDVQPVETSYNFIFYWIKESQWHKQTFAKEKSWSGWDASHFFTVKDIGSISSALDLFLNTLILGMKSHIGL